MNAQDRMPVIGCTDDHGIYVFVPQKRAIIAVPGNSVISLSGLLAVVTIDQDLGVFHSVAIEITDRDDPRIIVFPDVRQIMDPRNTAIPDGANVDAIARSCLPEHRGRYDGRETRDQRAGGNRSGESGLDELTAW